MATYTIWTEDSGPEDGRAQEAYSAEEAVEAWAERDDVSSTDYSIVGGCSAIVNVRCPDGTVMRFIVCGEAVPTYSAASVKAYTCGECAHRWDATFVRRQCPQCEAPFQGEAPLSEEESTSAAVGV